MRCRVCERLGLERVMLFGSYAEGRYTVASDIDLLVIFNDEMSSKDDVYKSLMRNIKLPRVELHIISKKGSRSLQRIEMDENHRGRGNKIL